MQDEELAENVENPSLSSGKEKSGQIEANRRFNGRRLVDVLWALLVGQILSVLSATSAICVGLLNTVHVNLPLAELVPLFGSLSFSSIIVRSCICSIRPQSFRLQVKKKFNAKCVLLFLLVGIVDAHSNWATLYAYKYSNIASIQLLDCVSIPTSMLFSFFILQHRYSWTHYLGALICVVGAGMMVVADVLGAKSDPFVNSTMTNWNVLVGDLLAISGATCYGISTVLQEYIISTRGVLPLLSNGLFVSFVVCGFYCGLIERRLLTELVTKGSLNGRHVAKVAILYYAGYLASMYVLYALMAYTIVHLSAVLINLSFLSVDIYCLLAGIALFQVEFHYLYFIAFGVILIGLILFAVRSTKYEGDEKKQLNL